MRYLPTGTTGLLVECTDLDEVITLHTALRDRPPLGVVDMVPAARTVLLTFDATTDHARVAASVAALDVTAASGGREAREVTVPVRYDGGDLEEVAELTGLAGGDPRLRVPRRATPRTRVPAGSVALASEFTGIYPREGPGGWQLIGHTDAVLWDLDREPPALLTPGTRVRFTAVTA